MPGTNLYAPKTSAIDVDLTDVSGNAVRAKCATASIPSATAGYAIGCDLMDTTTGLHYYNTGTAASCTFTRGVKGGTLVATTTGTTPVNVIGTTNGFAGTITGIYVANLGTTAANIIVKDTAGTVATIAKGTGATGTMLSATSLANTSFTAAGIMTVESSVAGTDVGGQAIVYITFTA